VQAEGLNLLDVRVIISVGASSGYVSSERFTIKVRWTAQLLETRMLSAFPAIPVVLVA
jgi:hypothetical protein